MQQILKPSKWTEKAAYKSSQCYAQQNEKTGYVVGKLKF